MKDAVAVVIKCDDKFLLIKRAKKGVAEDYWCPITGAVEEGETQEQAVIREAQEEMGIMVKPIRKIWQCHTDDKKYLLHWWHVKLLNKGIRTNRSEVKTYGWYSIEEMKKFDKMFKADLVFFEEMGSKLTDPFL